MLTVVVASDCVDRCGALSSSSWLSSSPLFDLMCSVYFCVKNLKIDGKLDQDVHSCLGSPGTQQKSMSPL